MTGENQYLFVYGTLRRHDEMHRLLAHSAEFVGTAVSQSVMYDTGDYPAALPSKHETDKITGEVYLLREPENILRVLDDYEEFDPQSTDTSLFRREQTEVRLQNAMPLKAWIYYYNRRVDGLEKIVSGDYTEFLNSTSKQ